MTHTRSIVSVLVLCLVSVVATAAEEADVHRDAVLAAMAELQAGAPGAEARFLKRLRVLGPDALPALLEALGGLRAATPAARALTTAIQEHRFASIEKAIGNVLGVEPDLRTRLRALRMLGRVAGPEGLPLALDIVHAIEPSVLADRRVAGAWRASLSGMLADGAARRTVVHAVRQVPPELHVPTGRALAEVGRRETLAALVALLEARPSEPESLLRELRRASPLALAGVDVEGTLRYYVTKGDRAARVAAADVAARGGLRTMVPDLIDMLDASDRSSRGAAVAALRVLTGTTAGVRAAAWRAWLEAEQAWFKRSGLNERLDATAPMVLGPALREVVAHPYAAASVLPRVVKLLKHANPGVRIGAVSALRALKRQESASALVEALRDKMPTVRAAAHQALVTITGERLAPAANAWGRLLDDRS